MTGALTRNIANHLLFIPLIFSIQVSSQITHFIEILSFLFCKTFLYYPPVKNPGTAEAHLYTPKNHA
jgi:hypothetical protein